jgi:hypothetical protein
MDLATKSWARGDWAPLRWTFSHPTHFRTNSHPVGVWVGHGRDTTPRD